MRVSKNDLQRLVHRIASLQHRPTTYFVTVGETRKTQPGYLTLDHNGIYGGWDLLEVCNEAGGVDSLIGNTFAGRGRLKAHEMESFLLGMLAALERPVAK